MKADSLAEIRDRLRRFAAERDWEQYHSPKNLSMALIAEAGELVEHFQWLTEEQSKSLPEAQKAKVKDEIADVFIYLVRLADKLDVDLFASACDKIARNAQKYPVEKARGSNKKYTEL